VPSVGRLDGPHWRLTEQELASSTSLLSNALPLRNPRRNGRASLTLREGIGLMRDRRRGCTAGLHESRVAATMRSPERIRSATSPAGRFIKDAISR